MSGIHTCWPSQRMEKVQVAVSPYGSFPPLMSGCKISTALYENYNLNFIKHIENVIPCSHFTRCLLFCRLFRQLPRHTPPSDDSQSHGPPSSSSPRPAITPEHGRFYNNGTYDRSQTTSYTAPKLRNTKKPCIKASGKIHFLCFSAQVSR